LQIRTPIQPIFGLTKTPLKYKGKTTTSDTGPVLRMKGLQRLTEDLLDDNKLLLILHENNNQQFILEADISKA
jgi:hypothetical protein